MNFLRSRFIILLFVLLPSLASASTPQPPAVPRDYVVDLAGVLRQDARTDLSRMLQELEQKTTAQVLVLTVQTLDGEDIRSFALRTAEQWKLGRKGKDNGVLMVVALQDRQYTFEIGYGLEGILPDSMVGSLGRQYLVPYFRKGDYGTGIYAAALAVAGTIASDAGVTITGMPDLGPAGGNGTARPLTAAQKVLFGIFAVIALILFVTHPHQCLLIILASSMGGRGGGGWSGGRSGGGGFGGGGGGGFGGGGASGRW